MRLYLEPDPARAMLVRRAGHQGELSMKRKSTKPSRKDTRPRAGKKRDLLVDNLLSLDDLRYVQGGEGPDTKCNKCSSCE
jgi:hypothetical protein